MIEYCVYDDHVAVKKYTGDEPLVILPNIFAGRPVTAILPFAFYGNKTVVTIVLPDVLQEIQSHAFCNCEKLECFTSFAAYAHAGGASTFRNGLPALTKVRDSNAFDGCPCLSVVA